MLRAWLSPTMALAGEAESGTAGEHPAKKVMLQASIKHCLGDA
jgi:hypothetical protein